MRPVLKVPRALPAPVCRPRISSRAVLAHGARLNSSNATGKTESTKDSNSSSGSSANSPPSPFWTPAKALLVSAFAAGLGYGYASYNQTPAQTSTKPQYGTVKDFEKVEYMYQVN